MINLIITDKKISNTKTKMDNSQQIINSAEHTGTRIVQIQNNDTKVIVSINIQTFYKKDLSLDLSSTKLKNNRFFCRNRF